MYFQVVTTKESSEMKYWAVKAQNWRTAATAVRMAGGDGTLVATQVLKKQLPKGAAIINA